MSVKLQYFKGTDTATASETLRTSLFETRSKEPNSFITLSYDVAFDLYTNASEESATNAYVASSTGFTICWDPSRFTLIDGSSIASGHRTFSSDFLDRQTGQTICIAIGQFRNEKGPEHINLGLYEIVKRERDYPQPTALISADYSDVRQRGRDYDCYAQHDLERSLKDDNKAAFIYTKDLTLTDEASTIPDTIPKKDQALAVSFPIERPISFLKIIFNILSYIFPEFRIKSFTEPGGQRRGDKVGCFATSANVKASITYWGRFRNACAPRGGEDSKIAIVAALAMMSGAAYFALKAAKALKQYFNQKGLGDKIPY